MRAVTSSCPACGEDFFIRCRFDAGRPARPARLFGLIPAREAWPDRLVWRCRCDYWWATPARTADPTP